MEGWNGSGRAWRSAFLRLRDETLNIGALSILLENLIFSPSLSLLASLPHLPSHEVTSDLFFLLDLVLTLPHNHTLIHLSHFVHGVCRRTSLDIKSSSWQLLLGSCANIFNYPNLNATATAQFLDTIRCLYSLYHRKSSLSENIELMKFLLRVVSCSHGELFSPSYSSGYQNCPAEIENRIHEDYSSWEVQTITFSMVGEVLSRFGSSLPMDLWQSTIEVLRKVMDILASKNLLVEDNVRSRFYISLLHCLHLVLLDSRGSLSDHVVGFVAALQMFFTYGLTQKTQLMNPSLRHKLGSEESKKPERVPYRPPHLRKKEGASQQPSKSRISESVSDYDSSTVEFMSSDSEYSDSDNEDSVRSYKARVASLLCIQDLCQADPKSFTAQWTMLLPTSDVLQPRKYEATLMTCLLFDPYIKARIASASTLAAMLDGASSIVLQVAEYKETTKFGSFTSLSSSLGQILMQLHTGILYLIQRETHSRLLAPLFKILMLLLSSTPYSRMPGELLPSVISCLLVRIEEGFLLKNDQTGLLSVATGCLTAALSTSPCSLHVQRMLLAEVSTGFDGSKGKPGILLTIFQLSKRVTSGGTRFEALQALRAVSHNYPNIMIACWVQVSKIVYEMLKLATSEVYPVMLKGCGTNVLGSIGEKGITAAIKVLDECLRAISGFKGTEDPFDDRLLDKPFTSDCIRTKKISSAPSYGLEGPEVSKDEPEACWSGREQWIEAIELHIPLVLGHSSAMVRTASVTCFAGITSSVFFSLSKQKQDFILSSVINASMDDEVPSVRAAACRAIGIIACFPQIPQSAEIIAKFIHASEFNTHDPLVSVRITASWAVANLCDTLHRCISDFPSGRYSADLNCALLGSLVECALRLTKDNDKIKSNGVRALGNLSRFVQFTSLSDIHDQNFVDGNGLSLPSKWDEPSSDTNSNNSIRIKSNSINSASFGGSRWLERMVQAFLSCVTTGNVKVQWNVCHALSNLFLNKQLRLHDMDWASSVFSVLLLLLRDSSNYKIRIQAAAALAVPASVVDYGVSFPDILQGLQHILENLCSNQILAPSSFKYRVALEKQMTSTTLHVLSLASSSDHQPLKDFLVKKAAYLEEWCKVVWSGVEKEEDSSEAEKQKKEMVIKAIQSLIQVYQATNHHATALKFQNLIPHTHTPYLT